MKTIKNLDVQDIHQQIKSTKKFIKQTKESVEQVKQALNGVTALHDGFEGNTADSIRSFFEETHKPFLEFMNSFLIQYEETLSSVNEEVLSFESDEHGFIREEFLVDELKNRLVKASTSLTSTSIDINQQLLYVKDIVNIPSIDSEPFINSINKGKEKLSETLSNMYDMDANAAKKLDKPQQDIEQMKTYLAKIKDVIDKNNITVDSYSSEQLTKQNFYKDFKLQAEGRQALTSDKPIPLTEQEYKALQDQIEDSKTVQDDRFEWDGEYFTLEDGRIIRAYTDPNSHSAVSKMAFEFVSSIPEDREALKEYKQEEGKNMFAGAVKGTVDFFFGDAITLFGPDATLEERAWAGVFLFVKPAKVLDKVGSPFLSSTKKYIDDLAESKGLPDAKTKKADKPDNYDGAPKKNTSSVIKDGSHFLDELKLKPNVKYESNGYQYQTDELGRIVRAKGELKLEKGTRNSKHQLAAGNEDRIHAPSTKGDHGGHLIGTQFNGSPLIDNIVAMNGNVNVSAYKKLEYSWANALKNDQKVTVDIKPIFEGNIERPSRFEIKYRIDDRKFVEILENVYGGK
ncbi:T7SS effector LXG polymorphic toxin [Terribacillus halophilus]|uniref:T7SS effector LXG polymorphic toxin n=1 Tax=Terribacillus halophilus TaxID=361279 RepID=UPI00111442BB|nr:T7SS effector LXG polymorphic toxin [Terribacillus halophilus]